MRSKDSKTPLIQASSITETQRVTTFTNNYLIEPFDGGFNIETVQDINGKPLAHMINRTMMRIELPEPLISAGTFSFTIKWWYHINNHVKRRGRSGYEYFPKDGNRAYVIAQFFPRMAVYNEVEGWQNYQFWGNGEFALPFGNYDVKITVPSDHILDATGELQNRKNVFSKEMIKRYNKVKDDLFEYDWRTQSIMDRIQSYGDAKSITSWETIDGMVIGLVRENVGYKVVDISDGTEKIVATIQEGVNWKQSTLTNNQMNFITKNARLLKEPLGGII